MSTQVLPHTLPIYHSNSMEYETQGCLTHGFVEFLEAAKEEFKPYTPKTTAWTPRPPVRTDFIPAAGCCSGHTFKSNFIVIPVISSSRHTTVIAAGGIPSSIGTDRKRDDKPSDASRAAAGAAGAAIILGGAYLLGGQIINLNEAKEKLSKARDMKDDMDYLIDTEGFDNEDVKDIRRIAENLETIHNVEKKRSIFKIALISAAIATGIVLVVGAFIASTPVMFAGLGLAIAVGAVGLFALGISSDKKLKRLTAESVKLINELEKPRQPKPVMQKAPPATFGPAQYASPVGYAPAPTWGQHSTGYASGY